MPVFAYRGLTAAGRAVQGVVDADSAKGARARLRRYGIFPTDVAEERSAAPEGAATGGSGFSLRRGPRMSPADLALVSRQLSTLLAAGVPVVEALAAGLPVVCSRGSALEEVAGQAATLVNPLDAASIATAIEDLLDDPAHAAEQRRLGRERARLYDWERAARQTLEFYRRVLGQ